MRTKHKSATKCIPISLLKYTYCEQFMIGTGAKSGLMPDVLVNYRENANA